MPLVRRLLAGGGGWTLPITPRVVSQIAASVEQQAPRFLELGEPAGKRFTIKQGSKDGPLSQSKREHPGNYQHIEQATVAPALTEKLVVKTLSHPTLFGNNPSTADSWTDLSKLADLHSVSLPSDLPQVSSTRDADWCRIAWFDSHSDQASSDVITARTFMVLMHERCCARHGSASAHLVEAAKRWNVSERVLAFFWSKNVDLMALAEGDPSTFRLLCLFVLLEGKGDRILGHIAVSRHAKPMQYSYQKRVSQAAAVLKHLTAVQLSMPDGLSGSMILCDKAIMKLREAKRRKLLSKEDESQIVRQPLRSIIFKARIRPQETKSINPSTYSRFMSNASSGLYNPQYDALLSLLRPVNPDSQPLIRYLKLVDPQSFSKRSSNQQNLLRLSALSLIRQSLEQGQHAEAAFGILFLYRYFRNEVDGLIQMALAEEPLENQ